MVCGKVLSKWAYQISYFNKKILILICDPSLIQHFNGTWKKRKSLTNFHTTTLAVLCFPNFLLLFSSFSFSFSLSPPFSLNFIQFFILFLKRMKTKWKFLQISSSHCSTCANRPRKAPCYTTFLCHLWYLHKWTEKL